MGRTDVLDADVGVDGCGVLESSHARSPKVVTRRCQYYDTARSVVDESVSVSVSDLYYFTVKSIEIGSRHNKHDAVLKGMYMNE